MGDADRAFKDAVYEQIARVGRAVAHPRRLELLDLLCQGPMTVEQLARKSALPMGSASQHLQHLKEARLVRGERHGTYVVYRLHDDLVCTLFHTLREVAEQYYADMRSVTETFFADHQALEPVDVDTLRERWEKDAVVILDVRPPEEYAAGHWPGALSVPLETLAGRLADLPRDRTIVAYCRGPYCVLAAHAVGVLRREGFRAERLAGGVGEWRARGLLLVRGDQTEPDQGKGRNDGS
ncbi:MAG: metalloregulator ArsR/SmtB family transcription factor [Peptococcaceae bacterium]|jgi:rhodanese-related sulfurtransferase|nr:metalloregulator ArsR/SmtB family transcription factor [Peptococcaceae bacterium]